MQDPRVGRQGPRRGPRRPCQAERNTVEGASAGIVVGVGGPLVIDNTVVDSEVGITLAPTATAELIGNELCDWNDVSLVVGEGATPVVDESNEICDASLAQ